MIRVLGFALAGAALAAAPLQCSREPEPDLRTYETPPEALYDLATRFKAKGDGVAYRDTLAYLVERYPSSRFAERAKQDLADGTAPSPSSDATR